MSLTLQAELNKKKKKKEGKGQGDDKPRPAWMLETGTHSSAGKKFDYKRQLPEDMVRIVNKLKKNDECGEEYALQVIFLIRTAVELHRAYHMTIMTARILNELKESLELRVTFHLGVLRLTFKLEDGDYAIERKVPYDYDSEFQDLYTKIASSLANGHIDVHTALIYQDETKSGKHTSRLGLFFRDYPTRIAIYPIEAATCAVVFFGGSWSDGLVAGLAGLVSGVLQYMLMGCGWLGGVITDVVIGASTGIIAGVYFDMVGGKACMSGIILGTLYWFFYGTAFVLAILEMISGELETGVIRFVAVCVKTFVLCLGSSYGLDVVLSDLPKKWAQSSAYCGTDLDITKSHWRMPMYILCSLACLMQYRFPPVHYWRGLLIQIVAYEIQYQCQEYWYIAHDSSIDLAVGNLFAAAGAVVATAFMFEFLRRVRPWYYHSMMQTDAVTLESMSAFDQMKINALNGALHVGHHWGIVRTQKLRQMDLGKKLRKRRSTGAAMDRGNEEEEGEEGEGAWEHVEGVNLEEHEEAVMLSAVVSSEDTNMWSVLMPAVYMLVPGSMIAKLWFEAIFPTIQDIVCTEENTHQQGVLNGTATRVVCTSTSAGFTSVFGNLMVISTSLALGLIVGYSAVVVLWKSGELSKRLWTYCGELSKRLEVLCCRRVCGSRRSPPGSTPQAEGGGDSAV
jgi:hypothetical protein